MILLILKSNQCFLLTFFMRKMGLWALNFDGHRCHRSIEPGSDTRSEFTGKGKLILPLLELFLTPPPSCLTFHLSPSSDPEMDHTPLQRTRPPSPPRSSLPSGSPCVRVQLGRGRCCSSLQPPERVCTGQIPCPQQGSGCPSELRIRNDFYLT